MPQSSLRLVKRCVEYVVVYVGMAAEGSIRARLKLHRRKKGENWTHFSVFEVWDNVRDDEIRELEGLFRHIYKRDTRANPLNVARGFKALRAVHDDTILGRIVRRRRPAS